MFQKVSYNDVALLGSLAYFCVDLSQEWDSFQGCKQPIHQWLLASCLCAIVFRACAVLLGSCAAAASQEAASTSGAGRALGGSVGELMLDLRAKGSMSRVLATCTWTLVVPFFVLWTFLGTWWLFQVLRDTPECLGSTYCWFSVVWLLLCYYWIVVHVALSLWACRLRKRVRRTEANLRDIEDDETVSRWGHISRSSEGRSLAEVARAGESLSAAAIRALPCETMGAEGAAGSESVLGRCECPICLAEIEPGDSLRCLPNCGHKFHRSCIDLWLVRRADCPLCKSKVEVAASDQAQQK